MGLVETTTYRVETEMRAKDEASRAFEAISKSAEIATKAVEKMKHGLGLLGVGLGFHEAKKSLIDFNAGLEDSQVVMSGMLTMFTGAPLAKAWDRAGESVATFNRMAAKSSLTTKDLVNMASLIERPLLQSGVAMNDIEKITFGAANAAKAFGIGAEVAAMDIQQALSGGVHIKDRFAMSLLAQKGIDYTPQKFNALDTAHKVDILQKASQSSAILQMAKKQGEDTFHGVISTLEDNMGLLMGRMGTGIFKDITREVASWNDWMDKNSIQIDHIARTVNDSLVTGFRYVKSVFQFMYDHADAIIEIGKVWGVAKLGGSLGGGLGMGGGNLSAITASMSPLGASIGNSVRAAILSIGMRFPGMIGPMNAMGNVGAMMGRLGGAAGALGPAGVLGIGFAAHELGEYLGVHRALTAAIDPARYKLEALKASMDVFDDAIKRTTASMEAEKGGLGTTSAKNALGAVDFYKQQLNVLSDIQAGRYSGSSSAIPGIRTANQRVLMRSAGFDEDEMAKLGSFGSRAAAIVGLQRRITGVGSRTYLASHETDKGLEAAMKLMTPAQRASIDANKATQLVMEKFMQIFAGSNYGMSGLNAALMSPVEIKKMLLADALDPFKGANVNQNITNHINVEVSAKDPDRWLMEVDEKVARKIRAPSQPRGSVVTRGGL